MRDPSETGDYDCPRSILNESKNLNEKETEYHSTCLSFKKNKYCCMSEEKYIEFMNASYSMYNVRTLYKHGRTQKTR